MASMPIQSRTVRDRGFSMVELLVAMLIGLIGTVIIFQVFEVSEGIKRRTTSGGDAQQNGALALYLMEQDLRNAGMGFNETAFAGTCNMIGYDSSQTPQSFPTAPNTLPVVPVRIQAGATATTPDTISVFYGSQPRVASATAISANMASATDALHVMNRFGFREGDLVLLMEPGTTKACSLMEVTGVPAADGSLVAHDNSQYQLSWMTPVKAATPRFNSGAGLGVAYAGAGTLNAARVFNLGNLYDTNGSSMPVYNTYSVSNGTLTVKSALSANAATPIADNIVHLHADYGVDDGTGGTAGDGIVDRYVAGTPDWRYVLAVRIAVVARSALAEKPSSGTTCDTTVTAPQWAGGTFDLSADADWKCYRYRVFETTVPLRNWIWKSS
jgi:type IV pilus assembly protein PilW